MKKYFLFIVVFLIFIIAGFFSYLNVKSPLTFGTIGSSANKKIVLVQVGNRMFYGKIKLEQILINNELNPTKSRMQVSNPLRGFIITDNFDEKNSQISFKKTSSFELKENTSEDQNLAKVNEGKATEKDLDYAISLVNETDIYNVIVKYKYLGMSFEKEISIN